MCLVRSVGQRFLNLISQWSNNQTALVRDETVCFNGYLWENLYEISLTLPSSLLRRRERTNIPWTTVIIPGYPCCTPGKGFHLPAVRRGVWAVTLPRCSFTSSLWTPNHIVSVSLLSSIWVPRSPPQVTACRDLHCTKASPFHFGSAPNHIHPNCFPVKHLWLNYWAVIKFTH